MKQLYRGMLGKLLALLLAMGIFLAPAAYALTPDQLKSLLQEYYLDGVTDAVINAETIEGILEALGDPYTEYLSAEGYQELLDSMMDEEIGGIGISAAADEQGLLIVSVFEESPAAAVGLEAGDIITVVNGNKAKGQTADVVTGWLKGDIGSEVKVTVLHQDGSTADYTAVRQLIVVPATTFQLLEDRVGYINCKTFGQQTLEHFQEALETHSDASVWMVDLRSNIGGEVYAVSQSLGVFVGKANITYLKDGKDQYILFQSETEAMTLKPTIVLSSSWTASAAEIFAGVIRDKSIGIIVGERTYGKGVAQILLDEEHYPTFFHDGDALRVTAYRYYTSSGSTADQVGIIPHLLVDAVDAAEVALLLTEDSPTATNVSNYLRINLGGTRWYLKLDQATEADHQAYFVKLLEALAPNTTMVRGTKTGDWENTSVAELVEEFKLTDYTFRGFADVQGSGYEAKINTLATYEIVLGDENGMFYPKESMTRAELCAMLVQALGLSNPRANSVFTDVTEDDWYMDAVNAAYSAGLVDGFGDGTFQPEETLTTEQLMVVMAKMGTSLNAFLYQSHKEWDEALYSVPSSYSDWAKEWVWLLGSSQKDVANTPVNLLFDAANRIDPEREATREEAAAMLYNILYFIKIIPS